MCTLMFYLNIVNKGLIRHCHSWLAGQYISIFERCKYLYFDTFSDLLASMKLFALNYYTVQLVV